MTFVAGCAPRSGMSSVNPYALGEGVFSRGVSTTPAAIALSPYQGPIGIVLLDSEYRKIKKLTQVVGNFGGLAFDSKANLYYADSAPEVDVFAPPYAAPMAISFPSTHDAVYVAIDLKTGVFAVLLDPVDPEYNAEVAFFRAGTTSPCARVGFANGIGMGGYLAAFDAEGNLFFSILDGPYLQLLAISGECRAKGFVRYSSDYYDQADLLQFDSHDQMIVDTSSQAGTLTYPHPHDGKLGKPIATTKLDDVNGSPVFARAISADGKTIFAVPFGSSGVYLYHFPSGGAPFREIATTLNQPSLAVSPPLKP